jgi:hypothetical protein
MQMPYDGQQTANSKGKGKLWASKEEWFVAVFRGWC